MRMSNKVIGAAGIAAVVAAGGFAYTAGVTDIPASQAYAYGSTTISGVTVTNETLVPGTGTSSDNLASVTFAATAAIGAANAATLQVNNSTPYACTQATSTPWTITCPVGDVTLNSVTKIALTVKPS